MHDLSISLFLGTLAAYLLEQNAGNQFITYNDPRSLRGKVGFAANHGLADVFVWEFTQDLSGPINLLLPAVLSAVR